MDNLLISTNQSIIIIFPVSQKNDSDRLAQIFFFCRIIYGKEYSEIELLEEINKEMSG